MDKPESSNSQVRLLATEKEEEKFPHFVQLNYKVDENSQLLEVVNSVYDKKFANQSIFKISLKENETFYF